MHIHKPTRKLFRVPGGLSSYENSIPAPEDVPKEDRDTYFDDGREEVLKLEDADVMSSQLKDPYRPTTHCPVLDLDFPCELMPSETPGHYHLKMDVPVEWDLYVKFLEAAADAGILERGYVNGAKARGATFIATHPWKPDD